MSKPKKVVTEAEYKAANAIACAYREQGYAQKTAAAQQYIGQHFKYRDAYSPERKWWLYGVVTGVDDMGTPHGISFEIDTDGKAWIDQAMRMGVENGGWNPISAAEFMKALEKFRAHIEAVATTARLSAENRHV